MAELDKISVSESLGTVMYTETKPHPKQFV